MDGLDLFSGIGGISKALDGYIKPMAYCEIDPYCRGVLVSRMRAGDLPIAPIWDNIKTLQGHMLPPIDIIYGGFPCQDISIAGRGRGLAGERSGLFFQIMRLMDEIRPVFVFLENVPNIRKKGLAEAIGEFSKRGYDCRWICLSAAEMGAPHKRNRWFLLAHTNSNGRRLQSKQWLEQQMPTIFRDDGSQKLMANPDCTGSEKPVDPKHDSSKRGEGIECWWTFEPNVGRVAHGIPKRVDRLRALGNAVVPAQAKEAFERLMGLK